MDLKEMRAIEKYLKDMLLDISDVPDHKIRQVINQKAKDLSADINYALDMEWEYWREHKKEVKDIGYSC